MGSVPQIGLGVLILGAAFVFGHYIQQTTHKIDVANNDSASDPSIQWQMSDQMDELQKQLTQQANGHAKTKETDASSRGLQPAFPSRLPPETNPGFDPNTADPNTADPNTAKIGQRAGKSKMGARDSIADKRPPREKRSLMDLLPPLTDAMTEQRVRGNLLTKDLKTPWSPSEIVAPDFSQLERSPAASLPLNQKEVPSDAGKTPVEQILGSRVIAAAPARDQLNAGDQPVPDNQPSDDQDVVKQPWVNDEYGPLQEVTRGHLRPVTPPRNSIARREQFKVPAQAGQDPPITPSQEIIEQPVRRQPAEEIRGKMTTVRSRKTRTVELETNEFRRHETKEGESLQDISKLYYGTPNFYLDIYLANQDLLKNPVTVDSGLVLRIPSYKK